MISRYFADDGGYGCNLIKDPDGDLVLHTAHAAEVERLTAERDALKAELDIQSPHRIRLYNDLLGSQALVDEVVSERDAAVSRAERAEEALRLLEPLFEFNEPIDEDTAFLVTHHTTGLKEAFEAARSALAAAPGKPQGE